MNGEVKEKSGEDDSSTHHEHEGHVPRGGELKETENFGSSAHAREKEAIAKNKASYMGDKNSLDYLILAVILIISFHYRTKYEIRK